MSRHRRGKHRAHTGTPGPHPVVAVIILAAAWLTLAGAPTTNPAAPYNPGTTPVTAVGKRLPPPPAPARIPPIVGAHGLTPNAATLAHYIQTTYPTVASIGGVRPDPIPDHPTGHAIDIMVGTNRALGDRIEADILAQAARFNVRYLIWQQTYHNPAGANRLMANRGTPTANHADHIHVTVTN